MDKQDQIYKPSREDACHDQENKITLPLEKSLDANIKNINIYLKIVWMW